MKAVGLFLISSCCAIAVAAAAGDGAPREDLPYDFMVRFANIGIPHGIGVYWIGNIKTQKTGFDSWMNTDAFVGGLASFLLRSNSFPSCFNVIRSALSPLI